MIRLLFRAWLRQRMWRRAPILRVKPGFRYCHYGRVPKTHIIEVREEEINEGDQDDPHPSQGHEGHGAL